VEFEAVVTPPISIAAAPVIAVTRIVCLLKGWLIFWLNSFAYARTSSNNLAETEWMG
jgi:hypothetical protein